MAIAEEAGFAKTPLASDLAAGVDSLSLYQEITFTKYIRLVLPLDNYVFWVKADLVGPSALANVLQPNVVTPNQAPSQDDIASIFTAKGSLHYATELLQEAEEFSSTSRVIFTAEEPVNNLSAVTPGTLWIGEFQGKKFAFSSRGSFYQQADLYHYQGFAVYTEMQTQIIDSLAGFDSRNVIVSNSMPAWLALNGFVNPYGFGNPSLRLYPSFLAPQNLAPPFVAVDIDPEGTIALGAAPVIDPIDRSHTQLCKDMVKVTLWGTRNFDALDFIDAVNDYSLNFGVIGIMNMPVVRDEHRTQNEFGTLAMKKTIQYEVSYQQNRLRDIAWQIIRSAVPNIFIDDNP